MKKFKLNRVMATMVAAIKTTFKVRRGALSGMMTIVMVVATAMTLATALPTTAAWAEESDDEKVTTYMTISPMNQQIILVPGESYTGSVKVANPSSSDLPLKYRVQIGSFNLVQDENSENKENSGVVNTDTITSYNQIMDWITVDQTEGEVQPNETKVVTFTINVPEDAPAGGQYASLVFQNDTLDQQGGGGVSIQNQVQIASLIYATVAGETQEEGEILSNDIPGFVTTRPLQTESRVHNSGNVHTYASYVLQVWPLGSEQEICTNEEKPTTVLVMPGAQQYHRESCDFPKGHGKSYVAGIFKVRQTVRIFGQERVMERTVFLCPAWLVAVSIVVIVVLVCTIVYFVRKHKREKSLR